MLPNASEQYVKSHYLLLDGFRGVAALMVLGFHLFEAVAFAAGAPEQQMFHGFLAVDFFLVLSGFVMGYAYDDAWTKMSVRMFFRKRLIRLHPMVVMGVLFGLVVFCSQGATRWDGSHVTCLNIFVSVLLALCLLPSPKSFDLRGNTEIFPLNGPHWSLFFEYIGNVLYALVLRKLPTRILKFWVLIAAVALFCIAFFGGENSFGYGWSSQPYNMLGGLCRMLFDYSAGLLLSRLFREKNPKPLKGPVFLCGGAALCALLSVPSFGPARLYFQLVCITVCFPLIVWFGARGIIHNTFEERAMKFLGNISYPLYAIHYPLIYLYIGWINAGVHPFGPYIWCTPVALAVISIILSWMCYKLYDVPVRNWLTKKNIELS